MLQYAEIVIIDYAFLCTALMSYEWSKFLGRSC